MTDAGELIKLCRKRAGLTQKELARLVGTTHTSISDYEIYNAEPKFCMVMWCLQACGFTLELKEIKDD